MATSTISTGLNNSFIVDMPQFRSTLYDAYYNDLLATVDMNSGTIMPQFVYDSLLKFDVCEYYIRHVRGCKSQVCILRNCCVVVYIKKVAFWKTMQLQWNTLLNSGINMPDIIMPNINHLNGGYRIISSFAIPIRAEDYTRMVNRPDITKRDLCNVVPVGSSPLASSMSKKLCVKKSIKRLSYRVSYIADKIRALNIMASDMSRRNTVAQTTREVAPFDAAAYLPNMSLTLLNMKMKVLAL